MDMLQSRETEISIIGTAMESRECAERLSALPEDFFASDDTKSVQKAVRSLLGRGVGIDLVTLCEEACKSCKTAEQVIIPASQEGWRTAWFDQYVAILDDRRKRRAIVNAASAAIQAAKSPEESPDVIAERMHTGTMVEASAGTSIGMVEGMSMLFDTFSATRKACQTGIAGLDRLTGGLRGGKLVVIGARPGVGKTALALSMAKHVARHAGGVLIVSLEMSVEEIMARLYASESGVDVQELESGQVSEATLDTVGLYAQEIARLPMSIATRCATPLQIRREAQKIRESAGLEMVVVDYLQLLRADGKHASRYEEVSEISRELKLLAMDLGIPVIALTQFNRESEGGKYGQKDRRPPRMSEAKDSGSIEQDANIFVVQYAPPSANDPYAQQACQICDAMGWEWQQLIVEKNRQGRTGKINIGFDKAHMTFHNLELTGGNQ